MFHQMQREEERWYALFYHNCVWSWYLYWAYYMWTLTALATIQQQHGLCKLNFQTRLNIYGSRWAKTRSKQQTQRKQETSHRNWMTSQFKRWAIYPGSLEMKNNCRESESLFKELWEQSIFFFSKQLFAVILLDLKTKSPLSCLSYHPHSEWIFHNQFLLHRHQPLWYDAKWSDSFNTELFLIVVEALHFLNIHLRQWD